MKKSETGKSYAKNKKAFHDYEILEQFESGILLNGDEVKSIKQGLINLKGSFVDIHNSEAFLNEAHISRYKFSSQKNYDPTRKRKLLLKKKEITNIAKAIDQKGVTATVLEIYGKGGLIKTKIGICRGKKLHDKRSDLKKKDQELEIKRALKKYI